MAGLLFNIFLIKIFLAILNLFFQITFFWQITKTKSSWDFKESLILVNLVILVKL